MAGGRAVLSSALTITQIRGPMHSEHATLNTALWVRLAIAGLLIMMAAGCGTNGNDAGPDTETIAADKPSSSPAFDGSGLILGDLDVLTDIRKDDLDALIGKGVIRVLVSYNRTNFKVADSQARGFEYELIMKYRAYLRTRVKRRSWPVQFVFIPLPSDDLLPALIEGRGDIVASGLTITPERQELVDFTRPYIRNVKEVVVEAPGASRLESLDDLSGMEVMIRGDSSYAANLERLSKALVERGLAPIEIRTANRHLATEDILELVDADAVPFTVVDNHLAELWSKVYSDMRVREDLVIAEAGNIAWAVRKNSPQMLESLNTFIRTSAQGTLIGNILMQRYFLDSRWFENPLDDDIREKIEIVRALLVKYGEQYGFDWRLLAALAYQESEFNQGARSRAGAVGIMQVLPQTAAAPPINIENVEDLEANIEAGAKYLAHLRDHHFKDPELSDESRLNFALAAYNAGPTRINRLRREAAVQGLDPNRWHDSVERMARSQIGLETVQYVGNINRYYIEFVLVDRAEEKRRRSLDKETS